MGYSILSTSGPWDLVAAGYTKHTQKFLGQYAEDALREANLKKHAEVLDVACGPGTLALLAAPSVTYVTAVDFAPRMLKFLKTEALRRGVKNLEPVLGDGQSLPFSNDSFDYAFSLFGLIFFPDRKKGFAELHRTLKPGGSVYVTSWAPMDKSPLMQLLMGALKIMNPQPCKPNPDWETLENPLVFERELKESGFKNIRIKPLTQHLTVENVAEFWTAMVEGSAPVTFLKAQMDPDIWKQREAQTIDFLATQLTHLPVQLSSQAWLGLGVK